MGWRSSWRVGRARSLLAGCFCHDTGGFAFDQLLPVDIVTPGVEDPCDVLEWRRVGLYVTADTSEARG